MQKNGFIKRKTEKFAEPLSSLGKNLFQCLMTYMCKQVGIKEMFGAMTSTSSLGNMVLRE